MKPLNIVPPHQRSLLGRIKLACRISKLTGDYKKNCPASLPLSNRLLLHFSYLELYWSRVLSYQNATGLEAANFQPPEQFYRILILTNRAAADLPRARNNDPELRECWQMYLKLFESLSHSLNPFDFSERCSKCFHLITRINDTYFAESAVKLKTRSESETAFIVR